MIKASLVLVVGLAAAAFLRRKPAALRHRVLAAAIACFALMPLAESVVPGWQLPILPGPGGLASQPAVLLNGDPAATATGRALTGAPVRDLADRALALWPVVWLGGLAASAFLLLAGLARLVWVASRARPMDDPRWASAAREVSARLGLAVAPLILRSDRPGTLFTWGIRRPKVLLPMDAVKWSRERIDIVLGHELAHVRRGDWAVQLLALGVRCAYWFNPLVWMACRRLRLESEHACDDEVLRHGVPAADYAGELLALASLFKEPRRSFLPAPAMARPSELERRVRVMLNPRLDRAPVRRSSLALVWLGMLALTLPVAGFSLQGTEAEAVTAGELIPSTAVGQPPGSPAGSARPAAERPAPGPLSPQVRDARPPRAAQRAGSLATIAGTVRDQAGRWVPNVPVVVTGASTSATVETVTDHDGRFAIPNLPPGRYEIRISKPGFKTLVPTLVVQAGATARVDGMLELGMLAETVAVKAAAGPQAGANLAPRARHASVPLPADDPCAQATEGGCVTPPRKLVDARPVYPPVHAQAGVSGEVVVDCVLKPDGKLAELQPQPDADPDFAAAAMHAIRLWEFSPTRLNGEPVDVQVRVTVRFQK